ncbi:hypothetical protein NOCA2210081 [metagenome]|uniref:WD40 repeat domain-containing protein n=1 Tax=metagenome TaxID=256318 RepID=A0A2P2BYB8_9ZZZZ
MTRTDQSTIVAFRAFVDALPVETHQVRGPTPPPTRRPSLTPWLAAAAVAVIVLATVVAGRYWSRPPSPEPTRPSSEVVLPTHLAAYSRLTASVGDSPPGTALLAYQHGHDVELFDSAQYLVMGTNGRSYRQVGIAVERGGTSLLSPDGTTLAIGGHEGLTGVVLLDLATGRTRNLRLPAEGTTLPMLWSPDGSRLWVLRGDTYRGEHSEAAQAPLLQRVDVGTGTVQGRRMDSVIYTPLGLDDRAPSAAMAPDGRHLAIQDSDGQLVLDTATLDVVARWHLTGRLVTNGWAADARAVLSSSGGRLVRQPLNGLQPAAEATATSPQGADQASVLAWTDDDHVLMTRGAGTGGETTQILAIDALTGEARVLSTLDTEWTGAGISQVSMATGLAGDLVNAPVSDVDRGPLSVGWLVGFGTAAAIAGLLAWWIVRRVARRLMRLI